MKEKNKPGNHGKTMMPIYIAIIIIIIIIGIYAMNMGKNSGNAINEVAHLSFLSSNRQITEADLVKIKGMLGGDEHAEHELEELEILVKYGEYAHASHTLGFLGAYVAKGEEIICPAHEIAHYYIFTRHDEESAAEHALESAIEDVDVWLPLAKAYSEKYQGKYTAEEVEGLIKNHVESIENGDTEATDPEIDDLVNNGICVVGY